jgi:hypothetical protein
MRRTLAPLLLALTLAAAPAFADSSATARPGEHPTPAAAAEPSGEAPAAAAPTPPPAPPKPAKVAPPPPKPPVEAAASSADAADGGGLGALLAILAAAAALGLLALWLVGRGAKGAADAVMAKGADRAVQAAGAARNAADFDLGTVRRDLEAVRERLRSAGLDDVMVRCREVEHEVMELQQTLDGLPGLSRPGAAQAGTASAQAKADGAIAAHVRALGEQARGLRKDADAGHLASVRPALDALSTALRDAATPLKHRPDALGH